MAHPPMLQTGIALAYAQTVPHFPQLGVSVFLSMPSSVIPSQSSSSALHTSMPRKVHSYSHPLPIIVSRLTWPGEHTSSSHLPTLQRGTANGILQGVQSPQ